ncbi:MAG: ABC transporter substrate-binding protein [Clostridia bacterium]
MKKILALALVLVMLFSLAACSSSTDEEETTVADTEVSADAFTVGVIGPTTGDYAIYGESAARGAQIAVDEINALGGDIQFTLLVEDDLGDPETAVNAYNTLKDQGIQALLGTITSGACISVAAETYADGMFQLTPSASSASVTEGNDNVFQVCFSDPNQGTAAADYIVSEGLGTTVAVIYQNDIDYSVGIYETFEAQAEALGLEIIYVGTFTEDTKTDFSVQLSQAEASEADVVFLPIYYNEGAQIFTQAAAVDYSPIFFGVDGMDGILAVDGFDAALAEGVYLLTPFAADATDDATVSFVTTYEDTYGETPNQFAADGYDSVYILYQLIQESGATSDMPYEELNELFKEAIVATSFDGLTGLGMTWSADGEVSKDPMAIVIEDGVYVGVE